jgi:hypothetical protein
LLICLAATGASRHRNYSGDDDDNNEDGNDDGDDDDNNNNDNDKLTCLAIDGAISGDGRNVIKKEAEEILLYADLTI